MNNLIVGGVAAMMVVVFLVFLAIFFIHLRLWIQALLTGTPVSIVDIIRLRLRGFPPELIVHAMIALSQRGIKVPVQDMEAYYLASIKAEDHITSATELAELVEELKQTDPNSSQT
ncbi:MAG: flotillin-like FloA family protein [Planctomycetia bacterium]|nr:flotillin-like FloA family protein [Planctomycetia bacterium]